MKVQKTNKLGIMIANKAFIGMQKKALSISTDKTEGAIYVHPDVMRHTPDAKVIRVSTNVMNACKMISLESIYEHINQLDFDFKSLIILLDNDKSGIVKVERIGSDFSFIFMSELDLYSKDVNITLNSYSFLSKSFSMIEDEKSVFVVKLLTYLFYGEITQKILGPKQKETKSFSRIINDSNINIIFCDSLWKQRISVDGFKVSGHFRLQPFGENRLKKKLIWIEEFEKNGYNRKATVELQYNYTV